MGGAHAHALQGIAGAVREGHGRLALRQRAILASKSADGNQQLAEIAKGMTAAGTEHFLIEGHTCDLGSDHHNLTLSQQRALAVKAQLVSLGVPAQRLQVIGFGETEPVTANTDETARSQNRRVQIFRKL